MQTIKELLFDAVRFDEVLFAHTIFTAVQDGVVSLEDPQDKLDFNQVDLKKAKQAAEENRLAMSVVKLYAMPLEPKNFAFILALSPADAEAEYRRHYEEAPRKVFDMSADMDRSLYFEEKNKHISFRQIKNQTQTFPYFVCEFQKTTTVKTVH